MKTIALKTRPAATCKMDLCSTCVHYPDCSFRNLSAPSVFFCEEFRLIPDWTEPVGKNRILSGPTLVRLNPAPAAADKSELMGLCRNCANRRTCVYPKPPGGVWHCEEYA